MKRDLSRKILLPALAALLAGVLLSGSGSAVQAYPEPSIVPKGWSLDFTHGKPKTIAVLDALTGQVRWYWYITYKIVNNSGKEQLFVPDVTIATEAGDIIVAGKNVPGNVFPVIKHREGNRLLENPNEVVGKVLQGGDYAREGVFIWPAFDHTANQVSLFVTGLSGESTTIPDVVDPQTNKPVVVRKTLMINYLFPGTDVKPQDQPVVSKEETWVMR